MSVKNRTIATWTNVLVCLGRMSDLVLGIDLGTTNSCAAIYSNNQLRILENAEGDRTTPSFVFFSSENKAVVGKFAKNMSLKKPELGVYEVKRMMGRTFDDRSVQENIKRMPFQVIDEANEPLVLIEKGPLKIRKTPIQLSSLILAKIKADAEAKLKQDIHKAVITVPAHFTVCPREATKTAAICAGFTVLKLLNEPSAAALSYCYENKNAGDGLFLVYDLGGGTFDVAVLSKKSTAVDILAVDGDGYLGGQDFDNLIVDYVSKILKEKHNYIVESATDLRRLRNKCKEAKEALSFVDEYEIALENFGGDHYEIFTKEDFEGLAGDLFKKSIDIVDGCLKNINMKPTDIKEVVLAGGSTRIPKIQELLSAYFGKEKLSKFSNPDECVAEGAALQAAMLSEAQEQEVDEIKVTDVIPLTVALATFVDEAFAIFKRNTPIPATRTLEFGTFQNNQKGMLFSIYEGERVQASKNHPLAELSVGGLTPGPPGACLVKFTMVIDENGILVLTATEIVSGITRNLTVEYNKSKRSDDELKNIVDDALINKKEDEEFKKLADAKAFVIKYCEGLMYNLDRLALKEEYFRIYYRCRGMLDLIYDPDIETDSRIHNFKRLLIMSCTDVVEKYNFSIT